MRDNCFLRSGRLCLARHDFPVIRSVRLCTLRVFTFACEVRQFGVCQTRSSSKRLWLVRVVYRFFDFRPKDDGRLGQGDVTRSSERVARFSGCSQCEVRRNEIQVQSIQEKEGPLWAYLGVVRFAFPTFRFRRIRITLLTWRLFAIRRRNRLAADRSMGMQGLGLAGGEGMSLFYRIAFGFFPSCQVKTIGCSGFLSVFNDDFRDCPRDASVNRETTTSVLCIMCGCISIFRRFQDKFTYFPVGEVSERSNEKVN